MRRIFQRRMLSRRYTLVLAASLLLITAVVAQDSDGQYSQSPGNQQPAYGQQEYPQANPDGPGNGYGAQAGPQEAYPQDQNSPQYQQEPEYQPQPQYPQAAPYSNGQENGGPGEESPAQPYSNIQPLSEQRLEQLVAPIALYPDTLVAQVLTASTYPQQVAAAYQWRTAQGYAPAEEIVAGANAQSWDPSVKALTAFPEVLTEMNRNLDWVRDLGNAYYNQPQDILHAVQVMRARAQAAGTLRNTPQESVDYEDGNIELAPANPQVVYVPQYNPWAVYGAPIAPYPGFSAFAAFGAFVGSAAIRFGWGIATTAFLHSPFGLLAWGLDWFGHAVLFHGSTYWSHSVTVRDWGFPHGGPRAFGRAGNFAAWNRSYGRDVYGRWRGEYSHPNQSYRAETANRNYRNEMASRYRSQMTNRNGYATSRPAQTYRGFQESRNNYARVSGTGAAPGFRSFGSSARPNSYAGSSYRGGQNQSSYSNYSNLNRDSNPRRGSYSNFNRGGFGNRSSRSFKSDNFGRSSGRQEHFSSHFGGEKAPKMPKMKSYSAKSSGGHSHSGGGHGGGKHHG